MRGEKKQRSCYLTEEVTLFLYVHKEYQASITMSRAPLQNFSKSVSIKKSPSFIRKREETKELCIIELRLRARSSAQSKYTIVSFFNNVNTCATTFFKNCFTSVPSGSDRSTILLHMNKTCIAHLTIIIGSMALGLPYSKCLHEVYEPMLWELRI